MPVAEIEGGLKVKIVYGWYTDQAGNIHGHYEPVLLGLATAFDVLPPMQVRCWKLFVAGG